MSNETSNNKIAESFPALRSLGFLKGKRAVPFVQQLEWTDCGAASLCMMMAYHGRGEARRGPRGDGYRARPIALRPTRFIVTLLPSLEKYIP